MKYLNTWYCLEIHVSTTVLYHHFSRGVEKFFTPHPLGGNKSKTQEKGKGRKKEREGKREGGKMEKKRGKKKGEKGRGKEEGWEGKRKADWERGRLRGKEEG